MKVGTKVIGRYYVGHRPHRRHQVTGIFVGYMRWGKGGEKEQLYKVRDKYGNVIACQSITE